MIESLIGVTYMRAPLHRYTFSVAPIRKWVESRCRGRVLNLFAGPTRLDLDELRVDSNPDVEPNVILDACDFVQGCGEKFDTAILDPPYSYRKSMEMYEGHWASSFRIVKDHLPSVLSPVGRVITFGYHSVSMGRARGFQQVEILLISHGGAIHDTIAVVEDKVSTLT